MPADSRLGKADGRDNFAHRSFPPGEVGEDLLPGGIPERLEICAEFLFVHTAKGENCFKVFHSFNALLYGYMYIYFSRLSMVSD